MARCSAFMGLVLIVFVVYLVEQLPGSNGARFFGVSIPRRKPKAPDNRIFVKGKGNDLAVEPGDTVVSALLPNPYIFKRPWRWHYALSSENLVYFFPQSLRKTFSKRTKAKIVNIRTGDYKNYRLQNRKKKSGHIGDVGVLVGYLMAQYNDALPYGLLRCSGKHYVEYLSTGSVAGSWKEATTYWPASRHCPVYNKLSFNMFHQIYKAKKFTLKDNSQPSAKTYELSTHEWPDYIIDMEDKRTVSLF